MLLRLLLPVAVGCVLLALPATAGIPPGAEPPTAEPGWRPSYLHWLIGLSIVFTIAERLRPARPAQRTLRSGWARDLFYLAFNGHGFGLLLTLAQVQLALWIGRLVEPLWPEALIHRASLGAAPLVVQLLSALVLLDLFKWCAHYTLHRVPLLWSFHQIHHSITTMDWIGAWRFHWFEIVYYQVFTAIPLAFLVVLGVPAEALLGYYVLETFVGNSNHANLRVDFGPLAYVLNSPRMHLWHHDAAPEGGVVRNFGVVLSVWDWIFGTAYLPDRAPAALGFEGQEALPRTLGGQLVWPLRRTR